MVQLVVAEKNKTTIKKYISPLLEEGFHHR